MNSQLNTQRDPFAPPPAPEWPCSAPPVLDAGHRDLRLRVPPEARAVAAVRHTLAAALATWGLREALCDASVVTSELVTNAIRHARPDIELHTALGRGLLLIEVRDASTTPPVMTLSPEALGGMGLPVVHALSRDYGWTPVRQGKCVWALMTVRNYLKTLPNHELDAAGELR